MQEYCSKRQIFWPGLYVEGPISKIENTMSLQNQESNPKPGT